MTELPAGRAEGRQHHPGETDGEVEAVSWGSWLSILSMAELPAPRFHFRYFYIT